jgi:gliding motility-associated-like protein
MQAVNFEAVRQDTVFSKVFWHFDDGSIDSGNVVNKTFKDTGCHQVQMISYYSGSSGNCLLGNGATDTTFLKVCVVNSLPLSIGNDMGFCRNRPLTLQSNINPDGFSYLWSTGATSSAISVTETGNYWLELKNGNCVIRDSVQVTVVDKPVLSIQGDKLLCSGDSILLQNSVNSPTVTYTWNNGKKGFSQWINKPGLYSLSGMDRGCYAETSINIGELSCPEIYVPTGFTPDGDGRNDIIRPICAGIDLVYFRVYNRYGQMIFETREDGKGWNGKLNGIQQSMATYVFVVEGRDKSGRQHIRKGTFVLIR